MFSPTFIASLDALCAQHGIARAQGRDGTIKLVDTNGKRDLRHYGDLYGLAEEDFGAVITSRATRYKLTGIKPNRPRYPLEMEHQGDGRMFKFPNAPDILALIHAQRGRQPATTQQTLVTPPGDHPPAAIF